MGNSRPYTHILKNLFHEQATELIPLLLPGFHVQREIDVEMPELNSTYVEGQVDEMDAELVNLALPGAEVEGIYGTEWNEHSGNFERVYRVQNLEKDIPSYILFEFQTERDDEDLPLRMLTHFATVNLFAAEEVESENKQKRKGKTVNRVYDVYPEVICPFPHAVPAPVRETFQGQVILSFKFFTIPLWEKDAREVLNTHITGSYFLLPAMKNANASLLKLAIEELEQRFLDDQQELGRHLSGMSLLLEQSEVMTEDEKQATLDYLQRFTHLITHNPHEA